MKLPSISAAVLPYLIGAVAALVVGLIISTFLLFGARDEALKKLEKAEADLIQERTLSKQCSDSVKALETAAAKAQEDNRKAIELAAGTNTNKVKKAQKILSTPPTVPGNDCKSASDRIQSWLKERKNVAP
jgi:mannitol-specific phosphotransferase system IIBC component